LTKTNHILNSQKNNFLINYLFENKIFQSILEKAVKFSFTELLLVLQLSLTLIVSNKVSLLLKKDNEITIQNLRC
jgi:hypothetical protein